MTSELTEQQEEIERLYFGFAIEAQKQLATKIHEPKQSIIILAGPTCAGKSEFAIELAKLIDGEVISADAMQVYRGMDIGTAKLTKQEMDEVPHHLIDIRDVKDIFNVVDFYYEARHCCQQILARKGVPIVVGGSGFYLHSLIYGPPSGPPSIPELRKRIEDEMEQVGVTMMFHKLKELDPHYAGTITKNDKQKIVRGLEIIKLTGRPVSRLSWKGRRHAQNYDFRCWFLHRPKEQLYKRIEKRCEKMIAAGFIDEVKALQTAGISENSSASQAIGYRQGLAFLEGRQSKEDMVYFVSKFKQASRNYAKRQYTWFRRESAFRWLDLDAHDPEVACDIVEHDYRGSNSDI